MGHRQPPKKNGLETTSEREAESFDASLRQAESADSDQDAKADSEGHWGMAHGTVRSVQTIWEGHGGSF